MPLFIVATPIGDQKEITQKAIDILTQADVVIGEEFKEASKLLKSLNITGKKLEQLNEHTQPAEVLELAQLCKNQTVALISDCGTPGFCDPGPLLIAECRKQQIEVKPVLGASSLMGLLSMSSVRINEFVFRGFLPAETEARKKAVAELQKEKRAVILMDTPYRLKKLIDELTLAFSDRQALLALQISYPDETYLDGKVSEIKNRLKHDKAEFMLLLYPLKESPGLALNKKPNTPKQNTHSRFKPNKK